MAVHVDFSDGWYLRASALASRFDERLTLCCTPSWASRSASGTHFAPLALWRTLLGDPSDAETRWLRRLAWSGWGRDDAIRALTTPAAIASVEAELRAFEPVLKASIDAGPDRFNRLVSLLCEGTLPGSGADTRRSFAPLLEGLVTRCLSLMPWLAEQPDSEALLSRSAQVRRAATAWRQASNVVGTLSARLRDDASARATCFGEGFRGLPQRIELSNADWHRDGQQVLRLWFEDGALYYKPRCLRIDAAAQRVFDVLRRRELPAPASLPTLALAGYGYQREAQPLRPGQLPAVDLNAQAAACLVLAWLCNARDLHQDNLRLTPEGWALIDLETWLQPERWGARGLENHGLASGLIDFRERIGGGDQSGLGVADPISGLKIPLDRGKVIAAAERLFEALRTPQGKRLLSPLRDPHLRLRIVYRPSALYASVLGSLREPRAARDGGLAILATDSLHADLLGSRRPPNEWALSDAERAQLELGDIPVFETLSTSHTIGRAPRLFRRSAQETLDHRSRRLDSGTRHRLLREWDLALHLRERGAPVGLPSRLSAWWDSASPKGAFGVPARRQVLAGEPGHLLAAHSPSMRRIALALRGVTKTGQLDLDGGAAGLLLAVAHLAAQGSQPRTRLRRIAEHCVRLLCAGGLPSGYSGEAQAGLAHGLSGMALALGLAAYRFERPDWLQQARQWLRYEDGLIDRSQYNWPARPGQPARLDAWCNGASGVLLARSLIGLGLESDPAHRALDALQERAAANPSETDVDHICCGELGRLLCWQTIAARLRSTSLAGSVNRRFNALEQRWAAYGPRLDAESSPRLIRNRAGLVWGWAAFCDTSLPNPVLFGLTMEDFRV